jgi:hypothetical protein
MRVLFVSKSWTQRAAAWAATSGGVGGNGVAWSRVLGGAGRRVGGIFFGGGGNEVCRVGGGVLREHARFSKITIQIFFF